MSVSEDLNRFRDQNLLSLDKQQCVCVVKEDIFLNDLAKGLTELVHIDDRDISASKSILVPPTSQNHIDNVVKEYTCSERHKTELTNVISEEYLRSCLMVPCAEPSVQEKGKEEHGDEFIKITGAVFQESGSELKEASCSPVPVPNPSKLVSAMKGSREKQGIAPKKLSVKWAPDVYDPPPSAASHVVTNKKQRSRSDSRKGKKNKQKSGGKSNKGRDKKQVRKYGGSSNTGYRTLDYDGREFVNNDPYVDLGVFDVGSPEPYCGSSFLKKSVKEMHLSVAEAT